MRKIISFLLLLLCTIMTNQAYAYSPQSLPISQNSKQWKVNIDEVKKTDKNMLQPKKMFFTRITSQYKTLEKMKYITYKWKYSEMNQTRKQNMNSFL